MTREKAIERIENHMERHRIGKYPHIKLAEALNLALSALRPVSREQVEKMWGSCKVCSGGKTLYQHTAHTRLYMNTFGEARTLVTECVPCPPYAKCCMKGISANSAFKINFCPECGRPLTDEAVQMVMERLEALCASDT